MEAKSRNPEAVARMIREARKIAVCSHVNPDGDTLGSAAAMALALKQLGRDVSLFCDGKVQVKRFRRLRGNKRDAKQSQ